MKVHLNVGAKAKLAKELHLLIIVKPHLHTTSQILLMEMI